MGQEPSPPATQADLENLKEEIFGYFDLKAEQLQSDFRDVVADRDKPARRSGIPNDDLPEQRASWVSPRMKRY